MVLIVKSSNDENREIDSLKFLVNTKIKKNIIDENLLVQISYISQFYASNNPQQGLQYLNELINKGNLLSTDRGRILIFSQIAEFYSKLNKPDLAAKFFYRSNIFAEKTGDKSIIAWNTVNLGNLYYGLEKIDTALKYYNMSLDLFNKIKKIQEKKLGSKIIPGEDYWNWGISVSIENISLCMLSMGKFDSALAILFKNKKTKEGKRVTNVGLQYYYANIASIYFLKKHYDSAQYYARLSIKVGDEFIGDLVFKPDFYRFKSRALAEIARVFFMRKQFDSMNYYLAESEKFMMMNKNPVNFAARYIENASFFAEHNNYDLALKYINKSIDLFKNNVDISYLANKTNQLLAEIYEKQGKYEQSSKHFKQAIIYLDSLISETNTQSIMSSKLDIDLENTLENIRRLNIENSSKEEKLQNQKKTNILFTILFILLISILFIVYRNFRSKQKLSNELKNKNYTLEELNIKLNDALSEAESINLELNASQEQLSASYFKLEQANETKNTLFSIIAHDLKNSIGGVRNLSQVLMKDIKFLDDVEKEEIATLLNDSSESLYKLLESLLLWSRSQRGQISLNAELNNPFFVAQNSIDLFKSNMNDKKLKVINNIPTNVEYVFDATLLDTIIRNLLNNAIKFSNINGIIEVNLQEKLDYLQFTISDNGVGMPQEKADNIFHFSRGKTTPGTLGERGTGLGLLVCYDFVKLHNGEIWFESQVGVGTTVFFTFEKIKE
jgi:signal transduction histidine kinase